MATSAQPKFKWIKERGDDAFLSISVVDVNSGDEAASLLVDEQYVDVDGGYPFDAYEGEKFYDKIIDNDIVLNIQHLEVKPKYRRLGLAKKILNLAIQEIRKKFPDAPVYINASPMGGDQLELDDLIAFYQRAGFKILKKYPEHRNALLWLDQAKSLKEVNPQKAALKKELKMNKNQKALKEFLEWMMAQRIENDANSFDYDPEFIGEFVEDQLTGVQHKIKGKTVSDLYKHITKGMSNKEINEVIKEVEGLVEILDGWAYYDGHFYKDEVEKLRSKKNPRYSKKALRQGTFIESEHTSSKKMAEKIARDHLRESPYYYNDWEKKERLLKKRRVNPQEMIKRQSGKSSPRGLWDNIRAKRARGEKPRKPGAPGAPTREAFERSKKNPMADEVYNWLEKNRIFWDRKDKDHIWVRTSGYKTHFPTGHYGVEEYLSKHGYLMTSEDFDREVGQTVAVYLEPHARTAMKKRASKSRKK